MPNSDNRQVQFYDSLIPPLEGGKYSIKIEQTVSSSSVDSGDASPPSTEQDFYVSAPRFILPREAINASHPPPGTKGDYQLQLPHVSLAQPALPWEQVLESGTGIPWMALLVFSEGELIADPHAPKDQGTDPKAQGSVDTKYTVNQLLAPDDSWVLSPGKSSGGTVDPETVIPGVLGSHCRTIDIPRQVFIDIVPHKEELPLLTHLRYVTEQKQQYLRRKINESELSSELDSGRYSIVVANRFPRTSGNYAVHLVALEGLEHYLSDPKQIPQDKTTIRLASLYSWSFTQQSEGDDLVSFKRLVEHLAEKDPYPPLEGDPAHAWNALRLPPVKSLAGQSDQAVAARNRLAWGYVPVQHETVTGESTFGWYRGPCTAVPAPSIPELASEDGYRTSADGLLIYADDEQGKDWGIFDLSYAVAWNMGRTMAFSHAEGRAAVQRIQQLANIATHQALRRLTPPADVSGHDPQVLTTPEDLARNCPAVHHFHQLLTGGLPRRLARLRAGAPPPPSPADTSAAKKGRARALEPLALLNRSDVHTVVAQSLETQSGAVAGFQEALRVLDLVPFDHLVPDARMLPDESVRFFYVDEQWVTAVIDGAMSLGVSTRSHGQVQKAVHTAVASRLVGNQAATIPRAGMVMRSQLAKGWPNLSMDIQNKQGRAIEMVRRELLAPDVMLCLFSDVPETVTFKEPHEDLYLGVIDDDDNMDLRSLSHSPVGGQILSDGEPVKVKVPLRSAQHPDVVDIAALKSLLIAERHLGVTDMDGADLAVELFVSSVKQPFGPILEN